MDAPDRPIFWIGSALDDLHSFPGGVRKPVGFALWQAQSGKSVNAKPLRGFGGAGVLEIVRDDDGGTYRVVYTVRFAHAVYVLHAFQKKSSKGIETPKREMDLVRERLGRASEHYAEWCKEKGNVR